MSIYATVFGYASAIFILIIAFVSGVLWVTGKAEAQQHEVKSGMDLLDEALRNKSNKPTEAAIDRWLNQQ